MKCQKCSFENREEAVFCLECGERLEFQCPHCGKELTKDETFCWHCENDISELKDKQEKPGVEDEH